MHYIQAADEHTGMQDAIRDRDNLVLRMQKWPGPPIASEGLVPPPAGSSNGLAFGYLGDMQVRLVFEQPGGAAAAVRPEDLARMELTPGKAVGVAAMNLKRRNGPLQIGTLGSGRIYVLRCGQQESATGHFLDRAFWREQLAKFPQGLLAALPRPGVLMFAPAGDPAVEAELQQQAGRLYRDGSAASLSACLYRFDAKGWGVLRVLPDTAPPATASAPVQSEDGDDEGAPGDAQAWDDEDQDKAAQGQKILIRSLLLGFVLNAMARSDVHPAIVLVLALVVTVYSLWGVVRLSSGLGKSTGHTIVLMVLSFIPLVSLVVWIVLSVQASRRLRAAGWQVGLLGARP
jgi:hypothetical protein